MTYILSLFIILPTLVNALSMNEAIQQMIQTNPQIKVKKEELLAEKQLLTTSKSDYLPTVDLTYSTGKEVTRTIGNASLATGKNTVSVIRQDVSATLTQNVFSGFDTRYRVEQQSALVLAASVGVEDSANSIALETATSYLDILRSKELLDIAQTNVDVHKKYLDQIKEKAEAGVGRSSDYKQTLSRYENAQSVFFLADQNYQNSLTSFERIVDVAVKADDLVKPSVGSLPAGTLEELITTAIQNNPTIHVSQADVTYAEAALKRSDAAFYPKADIKAESYWNKNLNGFTKGTDQADPFVEDDG